MPPSARWLPSAALALAWPLVFYVERVSGQPWLVPYAIVILVAAVLRDGDELRGALVLRSRDLLIGVGAAVVSLLGTYGVYALLAQRWPEIEGAVAATYAVGARYRGMGTLPLLLLVVLAEEVLWRGPGLTALARRVGPPLAMGLSLGTYVLAQVGSAQPMLSVAALGGGAVWTGLRWQTGRLGAPLICHAVWTTMVVVIQPLG